MRLVVTGQHLAAMADDENAVGGAGHPAAVPGKQGDAAGQQIFAWADQRRGAGPFKFGEGLVLAGPGEDDLVQATRAFDEPTLKPM